MSSETKLQWQKLWSQYLEADFQQPRDQDLSNKFNFIDEASLFELDKKDIVIKEENKKKEVWKPESLDVEEVSKSQVLKDNDPKPEEPRYPTPDECCGGGCRICVYDLYEIDLEKYEKKLKEWEERQQQRQIPNQSVN